MTPEQEREIILGACQVICQVLAEEALDRLDGRREGDDKQAFAARVKQDRIALKTMIRTLKDHTVE